MNEHKSMKILIVKMSSMGDVIHALPVLHDIKQVYPDAQIDWVVEQGFSDLVRANAPLVRRVLPIRLRAWRKSWRDPQTQDQVQKFKKSLQSEQYDYVIDCQGLLKSVWVARWARLAKGGRRVGYSWGSIKEPLASLFYQRKYKVSRKLSAVVRNRTLCAKTLGYEVSGLPYVAFADLNQYVKPREDWNMPAQPYVVLVPNASRVEKRWADDHWRAIAMQCHDAGYQTVWFWGGDAELQYTRGLIDGLPVEHQQHALLPPFLTIPQAAQCMRDAQCVVGLDSGLTHLSAALSKPTLGIFCDHDPLLAPITAHGQGESKVAGLGGVGQPPSLESVQTVLTPWLKR